MVAWSHRKLHRIDAGLGVVDSPSARGPWQHNELRIIQIYPVARINLDNLTFRDGLGIGCRFDITEVIGGQIVKKFEEKGAIDGERVVLVIYTRFIFTEKLLEKLSHLFSLCEDMKPVRVHQVELKGYICVERDWLTTRAQAGRNFRSHFRDRDRLQRESSKVLFWLIL